MAEKLAGLRKKGGGELVEPFYVFYRGRYLAQGCLPNDLIKQYKYIRLYTTAVIPVPTTEEFVSTIKLYTDWTGTTYTQEVTLTTTDVPISSLTMTDGGMTFFTYSNPANGYYLYIVGLHN